MTQPLEWTHDVSEFGDRGRTFTRAASEAECVAIARELDILYCARLDVKYDVKPLPQGRYRLAGQMDAVVTQACIVTLDPVPASLSEEFAVEFRTPDDIDAGEAGDRAILSGLDIEPLQHGVIDAGRVIFECLSAALDPYPRKAGAEFDWQDPKDKGASPASPFAALAKLKRSE